MNRLLKITIFILLLATFNSCFLFKKVTNNPTTTNPNNFLKQKNYKDLLLKSLISFNIDSNTYKALSTIVLYKDSLLFITLKLPIGVNIATIYVTPDTLIANFPNTSGNINSGKSFFVDNYRLPINFYTLQSILTDDFFLYPYYNKISNYKLTSNQQLIFKSVDNRGNTYFYHEFNLDSTKNIISSRIIDNLNIHRVLIKYSNFKFFNNINYFPTKIFISDTLAKINIDIFIKQIKINTKPKVNFKI